MKMWLIRENIHCSGTAYVLDEHAHEVAFCQTVSDAEMLCKLQADRDALLNALREMKAYGRIKYGNLNQDFNDAWERANSAIAQAEKEG
jgi:hypothetical protein